MSGLTVVASISLETICYEYKARSLWRGKYKFSTMEREYFGESVWGPSESLKCVRISWLSFCIFKTTNSESLISLIKQVTTQQKLLCAFWSSNSRTPTCVQSKPPAWEFFFYQKQADSSSSFILKYVCIEPTVQKHLRKAKPDNQEICAFLPAAIFHNNAYISKHIHT